MTRAISTRHAGGVLRAATLPSAQYVDRVWHPRDLTAEQRLAAAVLEHAIHDYLKYAAATDRDCKRLFGNAKRWVDSRDASVLYSFEAICDHLGLDAAYLRRELRVRTVQDRCRSLRPFGIVDVIVPPPRRRASNA